MHILYPIRHLKNKLIKNDCLISTFKQNILLVNFVLEIILSVDWIEAINQTIADS